MDIVRKALHLLSKGVGILYCDFNCHIALLLIDIECRVIDRFLALIQMLYITANPTLEVKTKTLVMLLINQSNAHALGEIGLMT